VAEKQEAWGKRRKTVRCTVRQIAAVMVPLQQARFTVVGAGSADALKSAG
jgi:hypothetical protein